MSKNPIIVDVLLITVIGLLALTTLNPYTMPMGIYLTLLLALIVLFAIFALFLWREQGGDEREIMLRHRSDRVAFLAGGAVLIAAIVIEGMWMHMSDPWVLGALSVMVITKVVAYLYHQKNH